MKREGWKNAHRTLSLLLLIGLLLGAVACRGPQEPAAAAGFAGERPLVIRNGTVIDGTGAEPMPDGVVIIQGERIVAVGRAADVAVPSQAQVIDAQGGTLLPGMIDSHVQTAWSPQLRREFLELGVTSICDLGSPIERMDDFQQDTWRGNPVARGFRAGPILTAPGGLPDAVLHAGLNYEVGTPQEARRGIADLLARGADVTKVYLQPTANDQPYPMLEEAVLKAIVAEAHKHGMLVRAHVTNLSLLPMALDCGVDVIEHVPEPRLSEETVVAALENSDDVAADLFDLYVVDEYDTLLPRIAEQEVMLVPTLARLMIQRYGFPEVEPLQRVLVDGLLEIVRRFHT
jgi:imidazolonepropionase-like amidohydrolase